VTLKCFVTDWRAPVSHIPMPETELCSSQVNDGAWLIRQEIQGSLGLGMAWTMRIVVAVSLVSGIVGLLLATKFYVLQEIFAGLLTVAVLLAAGVLLLVVVVSLREVWQYCLRWAMNTRSAKAVRHNRRYSRDGALLGVASNKVGEGESVLGVLREAGASSSHSGTIRREQASAPQIHSEGNAGADFRL
jgi:hypothetical protein